VPGDDEEGEEGTEAEEEEGSDKKACVLNSSNDRAGEVVMKEVGEEGSEEESETEEGDRLDDYQQAKKQVLAAAKAELGRMMR